MVKVIERDMNRFISVNSTIVQGLRLVTFMTSEKIAELYASAMFEKRPMLKFSANKKNLKNTSIIALEYMRKCKISDIFKST